jgi:mevalonate kinase
MKNPLFYAKILLFGEYGIIKDSKGLAIPYNSYKGELKKKQSLEGSTLKSNKDLQEYWGYLANLEKSLIAFELAEFKKDLDEGMYFHSDIPQGYGVGSSGALVAAIYDKYAFEKISVNEELSREKLLKLKQVFSIMESYFHGKSSGLDPLNSYLSIPILINAPDNLETAGIPAEKQGSGAVFLLDSEMVGETLPMINIFMNNMKEKGFRKMFSEDFAKHTDACIDDFLNGNLKSLLGNVKQLSRVVLDNFKPMIPKKLHSVWRKGLETNQYYLKLCGSGGGGYVLGFTPDFESAKETLKEYKLELVYRF